MFYRMICDRPGILGSELMAAGAALFHCPGNHATNAYYTLIGSGLVVSGSSMAGFHDYPIRFIQDPKIGPILRAHLGSQYPPAGWLVSSEENPTGPSPGDGV